VKDLAIQIIDNNSNTGQELGDIKIQVLKDEQGKIVEGIVIGNTMNQNQALIIATHAGEWKEYPSLGVGLKDALLSEDLLAWRHEIRKQLEGDGMKVGSLDFYNKEKLIIKAKY